MALLFVERFVFKSRLVDSSVILKPQTKNLALVKHILKKPDFFISSLALLP